MRLVQAFPAGPKLGGHHVEGFDERPELVARLRLEPDVELALADRARAIGQLLNRPGDAFGEVEAEPGAADQNQQRHREEDRNVDTLDRTAQDLELLVLLGLGGCQPRLRPQVGAEILRDDDGADARAIRVLDRPGGTDQQSEVVELVVGRFDVPRRDGARGDPVRRGARGAHRVLRQRRRFPRRDQRQLLRPARIGDRAVDLDHAVAHGGELGIDEAVEVGVEAGRHRGREPLGAERHLFLVVPVPFTRERLRGDQDLVDWRTEPARGHVADDAAAADQDEHGRNDRHRQQRGDELGAEPRERRRAPLFHPQLEQVAREHEEQRDQQRDVNGEQRVEDDVGEERQRDFRGPLRQPEQTTEHRDQQQRGGDQDTGVVERAPARLGRGRGVGRRRFEEPGHRLAQRMYVKSARPDPSSRPQGQSQLTVDRGAANSRTRT